MIVVALAVSFTLFDFYPTTFFHRPVCLASDCKVCDHIYPTNGSVFIRIVNGFFLYYFWPFHKFFNAIVMKVVTLHCKQKVVLTKNCCQTEYLTTCLKAFCI